MGLEDYKEIVANCAMVTTMAHMLSGTLLCRDIHRRGTSKGFDPMPFLGGIGMCILTLRYGWILQDEAMIKVNVFGFIVNLLYLAVYYYYFPNKVDVHALVAKTVFVIFVFLVYAELENPKHLEFRFGIITTVLFFLLIASPLLHLKEIMKTKNTDVLPFPLIFMGTIVSLQWLLYGIIIANSFMIFQNIVGFLLSAVQLSLFLIYPSKKPTKKED